MTVRVRNQRCLRICSFIFKIPRSTGGRPQDRLLSPRDVEWVTNRTSYADLTFCHDKTFESMHGLSHVWVGGFMFVIRVSPNDPTFYMHHAFIDSLWERFRLNRQNRKEREADYATVSCMTWREPVNSVPATNRPSRSGWVVPKSGLRTMKFCSFLPRRSRSRLPPNEIM